MADEPDSVPDPALVGDFLGFLKGEEGLSRLGLVSVLLVGEGEEEAERLMLVIVEVFLGYVEDLIVQAGVPISC